MKTMIKMALLCGVALASAWPASATLYLATYKGTLRYGNFTSFDVSGLFGAPSSPLGGLAFTAVYRIDDSLPGATPYVGPLDAYSYGSYVEGGYNFGAATLPVSATLTINGRTEAFLGSDSSVVKVERHSNTDDFLDYVDGRRGVINMISDFHLTQPLPSADFRAPFHYDFGPPAAGTGGGVFNIYELNGGGGYDWAFGDLKADTFDLTLAPIGAPEPGSWALMLIGIGGLGAALRRRRGWAALFG